MRCLVTGATGFFGRHLILALAARGDHIVGLARDEIADEDLYATPHILARGDLAAHLAPALVERLLAEYEVEVVFHLAAQVQVSVAEADPAGTVSTNVGGTLAVLEACRRQKVRRVVVASSDKVYGDGPAPYRESQPLLAGGIYATSKAMADLLAQSYARDFEMPIAIARCGNLYGPGQANFSALVPGAMRAAIRGEALVLRSDGGLRRDYLYVEDAVEGYLQLAGSGEVGAFNFGTEVSTSAFEVVRAVEEVIGRKIEVKVLGGAAGEIRDQWLDASRARALLGWSSHRDLHVGLRTTANWYRDYFQREAS